MKDIIVTQNLTKMYGDKAAVSSMDMHVKQGDIYGFIGRKRLWQVHYLKNALRAGLSYPGEYPGIRPVPEPGKRKKTHRCSH